VAAAAAAGSLMGARGNSGVIISQMLRGFAHHVRHRREIDTFLFATAMRESVAAARQALLRPVEGTIISVAEAAAEAAYHLALHEPDFVRLINGVLRAANDALDRTPDQLPALKEAGVVDSGGAGLVYFLEGILRFLPDAQVRATAFPRRPTKAGVFHQAQAVGEHKFCTEFLIEGASGSVVELRKLLEPRGESLLVIGAPPTIKVHVHTDNPEKVKELAGRFGTLTRIKVDNMEQQHQVLVVDRPARPYSIAAVVPGPGFEAIVRELGVESVVDGSRNPSVRDLLLAINKTLGDEVYLFTNDANVVLAAGEAAALSTRPVHVVPTRDIVAGIAGLFAFKAAGDAPPALPKLLDEVAATAGVHVFFAGKDATVGGVSVTRGKPAAELRGRLIPGDTIAQVVRAAIEALEASEGSLVTLYYGGAQKERDAQQLAGELRAAFPGVDVEYYYGGMKNAEYWLSLDG
jgi:DAK2 domain fusion protein YloV